MIRLLNGFVQQRKNTEICTIWYGVRCVCVLLIAFERWNHNTAYTMALKDSWSLIHRILQLQQWIIIIFNFLIFSSCLPLTFSSYAHDGVFLSAPVCVYSYLMHFAASPPIVVCVCWCFFSSDFIFLIRKWQEGFTFLFMAMVVFWNGIKMWLCTMHTRPVYYWTFAVTNTFAVLFVSSSDLMTKKNAEWFINQRKIY